MKFGGHVLDPTTGTVREDMRIESLGDLIDRLRGTRADGRPTWYRGQADSAWTLSPKVARNRGLLENETTILKHFKQDAGPRIREKPGTPWEWVILGQHYGLPTRLLDWSENPLIGLYFAVEGGASNKNGEADGKLFELVPSALNESALGSTSPGVMMFDQDAELGDYLPERANGPKRGAIASIAGRNFDRIVAQAGCFTVTYKDHDISTHADSRDFLTSIVIPAPRKPYILEELSDLGIRESTVYPELERLAGYISERFAK